MKKVIIVLLSLFALSSLNISAASDERWTIEHDVNKAEAFISRADAFACEGTMFPYYKLRSTIGFRGIKEGIILKEAYYNLNGVQYPIEILKGEFYGMKDQYIDFDACEIIFDAMTDEQYADVIQRDVEYKRLNEELETFMKKHYDENTEQYDSEENEKLAREMNNALLMHISDARVTLSNYFKYDFLFENELGEYEVVSLNYDMSGTVFAGTGIKFAFRPYDTEETEVPEENVDLEETVDDSKVTEKEVVKTPPTGISSSPLLYGGTIMMMFGLLFGLRKRQNH